MPRRSSILRSGRLFSSWQRRWLTGEVLERELDFWRRQLADAAPLALPTDRPRASTI